MLGLPVPDNCIFVQGADALERANNLKVIVFDKTGTLTKGMPSVVDHCIFAPQLVAQHEVLHLAAAAEAGSEHPLGHALLRFARSLLHPSSGRAGHSISIRTAVH